MAPALEVVNNKQSLIQTKMILLRRWKYLFFAPSLSLLITLPKAIKLLLMCFPSFRRTPPAPVLATRSDPAKSTKFYIPYALKNNRTTKPCKLNIVKVILVINLLTLQRSYQDRDTNSIRIWTVTRRTDILPPAFNYLYVQETQHELRVHRLCKKHDMNLEYINFLWNSTYKKTH